MAENQPTPTSGGVPITDELIAHLSAEAEAGYDVEKLRRRATRGQRRTGIPAGQT